MLGSEELKNIYNTNFLQSKDLWSDTNQKHTDKIVSRLINFFKRKGFLNKEELKCLDVGCAKGHHTESFRKIGLIAHGLDYSDVAIELAKKEFPQCHFFVMDGFNPDLKDQYDLIFFKGFSGMNTHDLDFVSNMIEKYERFLKPNGCLVISYSSNFTGLENNNDTVNWTKAELYALVSKLENFHFVGLKFFNDGFFYRIVRILLTIVKKKKSVFYLLFTKK